MQGDERADARERGEAATAPAVRYHVGACAGGAREREACGRCVPACPYEAVARDRRDPLRVAVDHAACVGCGACAAVCPTGALALEEPALGAQLATAQRGLAALDGDAPWLLVHCGEEGRRLVEAAPVPGAATLALPCLRASSDALLLGAFALGAAGVALVGCADCPHGEREALLATLARVRAILAALQLDAPDAPSRLRLFAVAEGGDDVARDELADFAARLAPSPVPTRDAPFEPLTVREVVGRALYVLERPLDAAPAPLALPPGAPYAYAAVDPEACTVCGSCATVCPARAFEHVEQPSELRLDFRAVSCVACGLCEQVCPESAIRLRPELRFGDAARRLVTVARDTWAPCVSCGRPLLPARTLATIERKLAGDAAPDGLPALDLASWLRTCDPCREEAMRRGLAR